MPTIEEAGNAVIQTMSNECHCQKKKCGHVWVSTKKDLPVQCSKCHSPTWWVPSKIKPKKKREK